MARPVWTALNPTLVNAPVGFLAHCAMQYSIRVRRHLAHMVAPASTQPLTLVACVDRDSRELSVRAILRSVLLRLA